MHLIFIAIEFMSVSTSKSPRYESMGELRYKSLQLKGSSLGFEHNGDKLRIREVRKESDFKDILHHIRFLVEGDQSVTSWFSWIRRPLIFLLLTVKYL
jgi:hypothetical protein